MANSNIPSSDTEHAIGLNSLWTDGIPPYKKDDAKGYDRYVDKLAKRTDELIDTVEENKLPTVTTSDEGKVMTVNSSGNWIAGVVNELPTVTSADAGKVLQVNSSGAWIADEVDALPTVTSADEGKVLTVNSSGVWVADDAPSGVDGLLITITDNAHYYAIGNKFLHSWSGDKTASEILQARESEQAIYVRVIQNLTYRTGQEDPSLLTVQSIKTEPNIVFDASYTEENVEHVSYYSIISFDGLIADIPVAGGENSDWITSATGYLDVSIDITQNVVHYVGKQVVINRTYPQTFAGSGFACNNYGNITTLHINGMDSEDASEFVMPNASWYPDYLTSNVAAYLNNNVVTPILAVVTEDGELIFSSTATGISGSVSWVNVPSDYYDPS